MADKSTPAPAVEPNAPAVASPSERQGVDLSDLQAELDSKRNQADEDEIFDDISRTGPREGDDDESEEDESSAGDEGDDEDLAAKSEDEEEDEEDADAEEDKPRKRSRAARYRDQITRLEHENAQLRSRAGGSLTKVQIDEHVESIIGPEPQEKQFDNFLQYEHEHTAWLLDKRNVMRETTRAVEKAQKERVENMRKNVEAHQERVEDFRTRNGDLSAKDYDAVMSKAQKLMVAPVVEELILESPKSAHLQYFFARNPQRLDSLNRMSERNAAKEIAHIEARLSLPQPKTKTAAPPPSRTPKGGVAPRSQEADLNAWLKQKYGRAS
jgi:hypothetical protein